MAKHLRLLAVSMTLAVLLAAGMVSLGGTASKAHAQAEVVGRYSIVQMPNQYKEALPPYALSGELLADSATPKSGAVTGNGYLKEGATVYHFASGTWYWDSKYGEVDLYLTLTSSSGSTYSIIVSAAPGKPAVSHEFGTIEILRLEFTPSPE